MKDFQHIETQLVKTKKLIPYKDNPKKHPESQVKRLASSIKNYGFNQDIVVDEDYEIIVGHGRLKAAKHLGLEKVPVKVAEHLTDGEANAYRIADNETNDTGVDDEKLAQELEKIKDSDAYEEFMETADDGRVNEYLDKHINEEDLEEPQTDDPEKVETDIQEGEVFKLGKHRLMCGDATNEEHVKTLMDGEKADMVFTDPPYGIEYNSGHTDKYEELENDDKILDFTDKIKQHVKTEAHRYICTGQQIYHIWRKMFSDNYKNTIIWDKKTGGMGDLENDYAPQYEMIIYCNPNNTALNGKREENLWTIGKDNTAEYQHPTQKPVELPARAIKNSSKQEDLILDLFAGSGSTLLAAEQTNRKAYCMELDPQYCQVIINRWEEITGKKAEPVT